jgi:4-oxalomesaconate tautomerase
MTTTTIPTCPVPCILMRGGTSRGPFFLESDLPADPARATACCWPPWARPTAPDRRPGRRASADQQGRHRPPQHHARRRPRLPVRPAAAGRDTVDTTPNCGNMLAAVLPFALERGLLRSGQGTTTARVLTLNTGMQCDVTVQTPGRPPAIHGRCAHRRRARHRGADQHQLPRHRRLGVPVAAAERPRAGPIEVGGVEPFDVGDADRQRHADGARARADLGVSGYEGVAELNANDAAAAKLEALRLACGPLMGLGDVASKSYPKMCLVAPPRAGGSVATRCFIPARVPRGDRRAGRRHRRHRLRAGRFGHAGHRERARGARKTVSVEHPTGEFSVELELDATRSAEGVRAALLRTARPIMRGEVLVSRRHLRGN